MNEKHLLILTLIGVLVGIITGIVLRTFDVSDDFKSMVGFPGEIFMQILKLMILPLIFSSLISSLGQMNASGSGKMGMLAVLYYMMTMIIASTISVTFALLIHPGDPKVKNQIMQNSKENSDVTVFDALLDLIRNMFPQNIVEATIKRSQTVIKLSKKSVEMSEGTNILGLIVFCTIFGIIISKIGEAARIIVDFFIVLDKVVMNFVSFLMWFSPFGIISLISSSILDIDDLAKMLSTMALYVITILLCLFVHCVLAIPTLYFFLTRKNPWNVAKSMVQPFVTALGTASSGASLPQAIHCVEKYIGVDQRIAGFVMPLGNTINMDGNALYETVAVIFIAQLNNIPLNIADIITICVTATFASIGLNAVPAGLVSMFVILTAVGLPVTDIPLLFTVDWLIDRVRTALNVLGDAYCASVINHFLKNDLEQELVPFENQDFDHDRAALLRNSDSEKEPPKKKVSFADIEQPEFNSAKTYSLKSAIIQPLRAHLALQTRLSQLSEE